MGIQDGQHSLRFSLWIDGRTTQGLPVTATTYRELIEEVTFAEQLGFDGVWDTEHHGFADGYLPAPFTFLAYLAARTQKMRLGTNIVLLPLWPIRLLAEEAAVLDVLSGGRFTLGVGLGYVQHEFAAFGVDRKQRKERIEKGMQYLRAAFKGETLPDGHEGAGLPVTPRPMYGERFPIYMGGSSEVALDRIARLADGFLAAVNSNPGEELAKQWAILRPRLEQYGRTTDSFPIVASTHLWISDDPERDWTTMLAPALAYQADVYARMGTDAGQPRPTPTDPRKFPRQGLLIGTPDSVIKQIQELQKSVPLTEICFWSHVPGIPHDAVMAHLERVARYIFPAFKNVPATT
ncbi:LLM class flavin-dependent oxidoreductase [Tengunoibacter tsumagoiensis]|uniref:Monooxygenase n=1 Tax=Tengunoibacter tsumagoiensis TaxID=2014871 RepID=A0A402A6R1_9CHLR|nr:LLM class flavin-dependent oxidoreductase [Tengunoibacter tsumagoiensis]GCE14824.1 monooxygenase [Tengunoibacter tsumagoiensis]